MFNFFLLSTPDNVPRGTPAWQPTSDEDRMRTPPPLLVSFCSIHVLAARYLSSFHGSEEIKFFLWGSTGGHRLTLRGCRTVSFVLVWRLQSRCGHICTAAESLTAAQVCPNPAYMDYKMHLLLLLLPLAALCRLKVDTFLHLLMLSLFICRIEIDVTAFPVYSV